MTRTVATRDQTTTRWDWAGGPPTRRELLWLVGLLVAYYAVGVVAILQDPPLGHDESVYALRARYFVADGSSIGYWGAHRAPGLSALLSPGWLLGGSDQALRLVSLLLNGLSVAATWVLGRTLFSGTVGLVAAALVAGTTTFTRAWTLLADYPSAWMTVLVFVIFYNATRTERTPRWIWWLLPLAIAATYTRFGAPITLAAAVGAGAIVHQRQVRATLRSLLPVGAAMAIAVSAIIFVPALTGSRNSPFAGNRALQARRVGMSRLDSFADTGSLLWSSIGPVVIALFFLGLVAIIVHRRDLGRRGIIAALTAAIAIYVGLHLALFQMVPHYLAPMLPFVAALAAAGLVAGSESLRRPLVIGVAAIAVSAAATMAITDGVAASRELHRRFDALREASALVTDYLPPPCVLATSYSPQVGWYSGCEVVPLLEPQLEDVAGYRRLLAERFVVRRDSLHPEANVGLFLLEEGKRQPDAERLAALEPVIGEPVLQYGQPGRPFRSVIVYGLSTVRDVLDTLGD